jgi:hypothetical protein
MSDLGLIALGGISGGVGAFLIYLVIVYYNIGG